MKNNIKLLITIGILFQLIGCSNSNNDSLRNDIKNIINNANGTIGVAIKNLDTGDTLTFNNSRHYPMQSVYKFPLAMAVLAKVDKGDLSLNQPIHLSKENLLPYTWSPLRDKYKEGNIDIPLSEVISSTVSQSDNNGCDILFRLLGGPKNVEDYIYSIGVTDLAIAGIEEEMHKDWNVQFTNWCKPSALVELLEILYKKKILLETSNDYLWKLMVETATGPRRIKGLLPEGTVVAHKTGSSGKNENGLTAAINDVAIIVLPNGQHIAIAIFVSNTTADDEVNERLIASIAKVTFDHFND